MRRRFRDAWALALAALALGVALAMPPVERPRPVHRYQVTFDISQSMDVTDVSVGGAPASRLAFAKAAWRAALPRLECGSRVGWSVFVGHRVMTLVTPLEVCAHYEGLLATLESIDGRMRWEDASSIGKGVHQSLRAAGRIGEDTAVVFVSDGHQAPPLRDGRSGMPSTAGLDARGLVLGVGGAIAVRIPKSDDEGRPSGEWWRADEVAQRPGVPAERSHEELSRLFDDHLRALARQGGLGYATLERADALGAVLEDAALAREAPVAIDYRWVPAALALLALCRRFLPRGVLGDGRAAVRADRGAVRGGRERGSVERRAAAAGRGRARTGAAAAGTARAGETSPLAGSGRT